MGIATPTMLELTCLSSLLMSSCPSLEQSADHAGCPLPDPSAVAICNVHNHTKSITISKRKVERENSIIVKKVKTNLAMGGKAAMQ